MSVFAVFTLLTFVGSTHRSTAAPPRPRSTSTSTAAERPSDDPWAHFSALSRERQAEVFQATDILELLAKSRRSLEALSFYRTHLAKRERMGAKEVPPAQEIDLMVRERPYAVRAVFVAGPNAGRRLLYSVALRPSDLLVREAGPLGWAGAIWLKTSSPLTHNGTRYAITDFGFGPLVKIVDRNYAEAKQQDQYLRQDDGWDSAGRYCIRHTLKPGVTKAYASTSRLCFDTRWVLPMVVESSDLQGLLESFVFTDTKALPPSPADPFTPEAAGLK